MAAGAGCGMPPLHALHDELKPVLLDPPRLPGPSLPPLPQRPCEHLRVDSNYRSTHPAALARTPHPPAAAQPTIRSLKSLSQAPASAFLARRALPGPQDHRRRSP
jgi:hypothetical protein